MDIATDAATITLAGPWRASSTLAARDLTDAARRGIDIIVSIGGSQFANADEPTQFHDTIRAFCAASRSHVVLLSDRTDNSEELTRRTSRQSGFVLLRDRIGHAPAGRPWSWRRRTFVVVDEQLFMHDGTDIDVVLTALPLEHPSVRAALTTLCPLLVIAPGPARATGVARTPAGRAITEELAFGDVLHLDLHTLIGRDGTSWPPPPRTQQA